MTDREDEARRAWRRSHDLEGAFIGDALELELERPVRSSADVLEIEKYRSMYAQDERTRAEEEQFYLDREAHKADRAADPHR